MPLMKLVLVFEPSAEANMKIKELVDVTVYKQFHLTEYVPPEAGIQQPQQAQHRTRTRRKSTKILAKSERLVLDAFKASPNLRLTRKDVMLALKTGGYSQTTANPVMSRLRRAGYLTQDGDIFSLTAEGSQV